MTPSAAVAGGWWSSIHGSRTTVAPGQRVEVSATLAAAPSGRFHAYLLRGFDEAVLEPAMEKRDPGDWWSLGGAEAILVGPVTITGPEAGLARARAEFTVPDLPSATYHVMFCDAGCTKPLAEVIPTGGFTVVADPATARLAHRVDGLEQQLAVVRRRANRARHEARIARSAVLRLRARVAATTAEEPSTNAGWLIAAALAAGALGVGLLRRR